MAFTMACPNFNKGLKMVSGPLGVKVVEEIVDDALRVIFIITPGLPESFLHSS
jgi:hypothetical protein